MPAFGRLPQRLTPRPAILRDDFSPRRSGANQLQNYLGADDGLRRDVTVLVHCNRGRDSRDAQHKVNAEGLIEDRDHRGANEEHGSQD